MTSPPRRPHLLPRHKRKHGGHSEDGDDEQGESTPQFCPCGAEATRGRYCLPCYADHDGV